MTVRGVCVRERERCYEMETQSTSTCKTRAQHSYCDGQEAQPGILLNLKNEGVWAPLTRRTDGNALQCPFCATLIAQCLGKTTDTHISYSSNERRNTHFEQSASSGVMNGEHHYGARHSTRPLKGGATTETLSSDRLITGPNSHNQRPWVTGTII